MKKEGYSNAGFPDGLLMGSQHGFSQGFDTYFSQRVGIAEIIPKAKKWLNKNKQNKFFLFIHCYDIHDPYNPPPPYNTIFHDFTYTGGLIPSNKTLTAIATKKLKINNEDLQHLDENQLPVPA